MQTNEVPTDTRVITRRAGANKFGTKKCPFCHSTGDKQEVFGPVGLTLHFFCFKDDTSAREYAISGLCQDCQDGFFN